MRSGARRAVPLAAFAIAALALASCGDDETAGDERTLTYFLARGSVESFGEEQGRGGAPQPGVTTLAGTLEDGDGNAVGGLNYVCTRVTGERGVVSNVPTQGKHNCSGTVDLPDGQLSIAYGGAIREVIPFKAGTGPPGVTGSITGGTGDYAGATGTYEVVLGGMPQRTPSPSRCPKPTPGGHTPGPGRLTGYRTRESVPGRWWVAGVGRS
jgi:hypothetical protein